LQNAVGVYYSTGCQCVRPPTCPSVRNKCSLAKR